MGWGQGGGGGDSNVMFKKISQNFVKSPLNFCLISQILVHSLWHVCAWDIFDLLSLGDEMSLLFALLNPLNFDEMCIVTNLKYIITVCYDVIILYNFLPMHSSFFPLVYLNTLTPYHTYPKFLVCLQTIFSIIFSFLFKGIQSSIAYNVLLSYVP